MPGYVAEFMTPDGDGRACSSVAPRRLAAVPKKSAAIRRAWDNSSGDYAPIRPSSAPLTRMLLALAAVSDVGSILIRNADCQLMAMRRRVHVSNDPR